MIRPTWLTRSSLMRWRPMSSARGENTCWSIPTPYSPRRPLMNEHNPSPFHQPHREQHNFSGSPPHNKTKKPPKRVSLTTFPDRVKTISTRESSKLRDALEESIPLSEKPRSFTCNQLFWTTETGGPRTIFISRKETPQSLAYLYEIAKWVQHHHPAARILLEEPNAGSLEDKDDLPIYVFPTTERHELSRIVDIIICLGGDGSLLHISSTFGRGRIPPVLAFSLGTLSFLASFKAEEYPVALASVFRGGFLYTNRMRLVCRVRKTSRDSIPPEHAAQFRAVDGAYECQVPVINELTFHRGMEGQTIKIDCSVNERHITTASGDGLIVGTATGSTAYSLSCGGSMVHPAIKVIMLTPVCARSLSFRPLILPWDINVRLTISPDSRAQRGNVHLDGFSPIPITNEDVVYVSRSPFSVPTISKQDSISDWAHDINVKLKWNQIPVPLADGGE